MTDSSTDPELLLPPALIHALRIRSFPRLFRMTGSPGNRGFGRVIRQRIRDIVLREPTRAERAITVAYMGSYLVDHIIQAEKTAAHLLEHRELSEAEEHTLWDRTYGKVIRQLAVEMPDGMALMDEIRRLEYYDDLPLSVHRFRARHWSRVERFLTQSDPALRPSGAELFLLGRLDEVLDSRRTARRKALVVALIASLITDRRCWQTHEDWSATFHEVMIDLYPSLVRRGDVLAALTRLHPEPGSGNGRTGEI